MLIMISVPNTILIESSKHTELKNKLNFKSIDENQEYLETENNASWKTKIGKQILVKKGDVINLEQAMLRNKGSGDGVIEFDGEAFNNQLKDNETQLELGYYITDDWKFNCPLFVF